MGAPQRSVCQPLAVTTTTSVALQPPFPRWVEGRTLDRWPDAHNSEGLCCTHCSRTRNQTLERPNTCAQMPVCWGDAALELDRGGRGFPYGLAASSSICISD